MPGPGLDLVGDEELAEVADVIRSGRLSYSGCACGTTPRSRAARPSASS